MIVMVRHLGLTTLFHTADRQKKIMASVGDLEAYQVGKRFVCEGFTGTILYVGKVPPTEGKSSTCSEEKKHARSCDHVKLEY